MENVKIVLGEEAEALGVTSEVNRIVDIIKPLTLEQRAFAIGVQLSLLTRGLREGCERFDTVPDQFASIQGFLALEDLWKKAYFLMKERV